MTLTNEKKYVYAPVKWDTNKDPQYGPVLDTEAEPGDNGGYRKAQFTELGPTNPMLNIMILWFMTKLLEVGLINQVIVLCCAEI